MHFFLVCFESILSNSLGGKEDMRQFRQAVVMLKSAVLFTQENTNSEFYEVFFSNSYFLLTYFLILNLSNFNVLWVNFNINQFMFLNYREN